MPYEIPDGKGNRDFMLEPEFWFRAGADDAQVRRPHADVPGFQTQYDDGYTFGEYVHSMLDPMPTHRQFPTMTSETLTTSPTLTAGRYNVV
jgi:hypothetical protein